MDPVTEIKGELNRVPCPQCHKSRFDLNLHCELGYDESYTLLHARLRLYFNISTETRSLHKAQPDIEKKVAELLCSSCRKAGAELRFRCDLDDRTCLYVAICTHCGAISHQYR